jgi:hypothetical protein
MMPDAPYSTSNELSDTCHLLIIGEAKPSTTNSGQGQEITGTHVGKYL